MYDAIFFTDHVENPTFHVPSRIPPIGAFKCAHILRKRGYKVLVVNNTNSFTEEELEHLIFLAVGSRTKFVGFSTSFYWVNFDSLLQGDKGFEDRIIARIRKRNPNIKIAVGGAKVHTEFSNKNAYVAVLGFAETSIINLMNHLDNHSSLRNSYKNTHGVTIIDDRLAPGYEFTKDPMVWLPEDVVNFQILPMETARGCIFKCKFCSYPLNGKKKMDFVKEYDVLREEFLQAYNDFGINKFLVSDDTFNDNVEKLNRIEDTVQSLPVQPMLWSYIRLDLLNRHIATLNTLNNIGIRAMLFGIETLHPKASAEIGKGGPKQPLLDTLELIYNDYPHIGTHGTFIAGLPYEPKESFMNTMERLVTKDIKLNNWTFEAFRIQANKGYTFTSEFDKNYEKYGYKDAGFLPGSGWYNSGLVNWDNGDTTYTEVVKIVEDFQKRASEANTFSVTARWVLGMLQFGISGLDYNKLIRTPAKDLDWNLLKRGEQVFLEEYKRKLFKILDGYV